MNKQRILQICEYICLGLSIIGIIVATLTQQVVYGFIPISLNIVLNLVNRPKLHPQFNYAQIQSQINELQTKLQNMNQEFYQLKNEVNDTMNTSNQKLEQIETFRKQLTEIITQKVDQEINQMIDHKIKQLIEESIQTLNTELNTLNQQIKQIEEEQKNQFSQIHHDLHTIKEQVTNLDTLFTALIQPLDINKTPENKQNLVISEIAEMQKYQTNVIDIHQSLEIEETEDKSQEIEELLPEIPIISLSDDHNNKLVFAKTLKIDANQILSLCFSPNGQILAIGTDDKNIELWDLNTTKKRTFTGHGEFWSKGINSLAFSPDGKLLASGSDDKTIKLWDVNTGTELFTFTGHENKINAIAYSPLGKVLASVSKDQSVKIWSLETQKEIYSFKGHTDEILSVAFSPDGKLLASGGGPNDKTIKIIQLAENKVRTLKVHADWFGGINSLVFSPDGEILISGGQNRLIKFWDVKTWEEIKTLSGHSDTINALVISPNSKLLASASNDKTMKLWSVDNGEEISSVKCSDTAIYSLAFSPNGKILAAGSGDKTITLFPCK